MSAKDKLSKIKCPIQRVLARHVGACLDAWSVRFADLDPEQRLVAHPTATSDAERWRNLGRMPALGMVARLGRDLGLSTNDLHGTEARQQPSGRTSPAGRAEVPELAELQRTTVISAMRLWDAMAEDRSDVAACALGRYEVELRKARDEIAEVTAKQHKSCWCPACQSRWATLPD